MSHFQAKPFHVVSDRRSVLVFVGVEPLGELSGNVTITILANVPVMKTRPATFAVLQPLRTSPTSWHDVLAVLAAA